LHEQIGSVYLSATNGNRGPETVIKVKRKPAGELKHIGRNSMPMPLNRQEDNLKENREKRKRSLKGSGWPITLDRQPENHYSNR
jgi:hypothetical protein